MSWEPVDMFTVDDDRSLDHLDVLIQRDGGFYKVLLIGTPWGKALTGGQSEALRKLASKLRQYAKQIEERAHEDSDEEGP